MHIILISSLVMHQCDALTSRHTHRVTRDAHCSHGVSCLLNWAHFQSHRAQNSIGGHNNAIGCIATLVFDSHVKSLRDRRYSRISAAFCNCWDRMQAVFWVSQLSPELACPTTD